MTSTDSSASTLVEGEHVMKQTSPGHSATEVDSEMTETGAFSPLVENMFRACRKRRRKIKVSDSTGAELTGGALLTRSLVLRRLLRRLILQPDERFVGILLPPTCAAIASNVALTLDKRVPVNLNYTLNSEVINGCIARAGIRHILTSRRFMERVSLDLNAELVFLEDLRETPKTTDKLIGALQGYVLPIALLSRLLGQHRIPNDDLLTIIFTSGTTGQPKGAMLTFENVASNIEAVKQVLRLKPTDKLLGVLPFFHSFGYTVTLWTILTIDVAGIYHVNPLDGQVVGKLCRDRGGTILLATPMFLRTYLRRCEPEDFASLEVLITGGERLPKQLADEVETKFGIRPVEGYGATETSPLISANIPSSRALEEPSKVAREGTVGKTPPNVRVKVLDLESSEELGPDQQGMLWVTGPNVMKGYFGQPDATADVIRDGWYMTGDVATISADEFITIVGRESRFAKIGGEMVPHGRIEEVLIDLTGPAEDGGPQVAVTSIPDEKRGERLVVVHTPLSQTSESLVEGLSRAGLPNLYLPSQDSFIEVEVLPFIGTGKLDLKEIRRIADKAFAANTTTLPRKPP